MWIVETDIYYSVNKQTRFIDLTLKKSDFTFIFVLKKQILFFIFFPV